MEAVDFVQYPNRDHHVTLRTASSGGGTPYETPVVIYTGTVPGDAPLSAIQLRRRRPLMTLPSYWCRRLRLKGVRGLQGEIVVSFLAITKSMLLKEVRIGDSRPFSRNSWHLRTFCAYCQEDLQHVEIGQLKLRDCNSRAVYFR